MPKAGFPFVKWQTEFMYRRFQAGRGADDLFRSRKRFTIGECIRRCCGDFEKGWVAGIRGDYVHMQDSHIYR